MNEEKELIEQVSEGKFYLLLLAACILGALSGSLVALVVIILKRLGAF